MRSREVVARSMGGGPVPLAALRPAQELNDLLCVANGPEIKGTSHLRLNLTGATTTFPAGFGPMKDAPKSR